MQVSLKDALTTAVLVTLLILTFWSFNSKQIAPPASAPEPSCPGGICRPYQAKPFNVVCPYCRNVLSVQPSATGQVGTVTGATPAAK